MISSDRLGRNQRCDQPRSYSFLAIYCRELLMWINKEAHLSSSVLAGLTRRNLGQTAANGGFFDQG
jgi:hypothetical protein